MTIRGFTDLNVGKTGMDLAAEVYRLSKSMPKAEQYGMTSQMLRSASSMPANIAEGFQRGTRKDYARFVGIARGSLGETETFLLLAIRVGHLDAASAAPALDLSRKLGRQLTRLRQRLDEKIDTP
jgi:four helix bundle protein